MPSPIGHTLAGLTVGWLFEPDSGPAPQDAGPHPGLRKSAPAVHRRRDRVRAALALTPFAVACAAAAALPDADLLIPHFHRTASHSVTATLLILIVTAMVTGKVTRRPAWTLALALAGAHATHLLLDWLGTDRNPPAGLQIFWPFDSAFYISGWDIFPPVARGAIAARMLAINLNAAVWELVLMGPFAGAAWLLRRRRRSRVRTSVPDVQRRPSGAAADTAGISDRQGRRGAPSESRGRRRGR
jgi:membrane-bound metal-dependent hydrolase YbcI (DUF457 family)